MTSVDLDQAIELINGKKTSVEDICKFLFSYIQNYQDERESYHLQEFKDEHQHRDDVKKSSEVVDQYADILEKKIQADVKRFAVSFANDSIDKILDGMNEKRFRTKKGPRNFLVLLAALKELYEV